MLSTFKSKFIFSYGFLFELPNKNESSCLQDLRPLAIALNPLAVIPLWSIIVYIIYSYQELLSFYRNLCYFLYQSPLYLLSYYYLKAYKLQYQDTILIDLVILLLLMLFSDCLCHQWNYRLAIIISHLNQLIQVYDILWYYSSMHKLHQK